jgi:hypothetical protein
MTNKVRRLSIDLSEADDGAVRAIVRLGHEGHKFEKGFEDWSAAVDGLHNLLSSSLGEDDEDDGEEYNYSADGRTHPTLRAVLRENVEGRFPEPDCDIIGFQFLATGPTSFEVAGLPRNPEVGPLRTVDDYDSLDDALHYFRNVVAHEWQHYVPIEADEGEVH